MPQTYAEQLDSVQTAIAEIESKGQSYAIAGRSKSRGDLEQLYARERWLRQRVASEERGGIRVRYAVPPR